MKAAGPIESHIISSNMSKVLLRITVLTLKMQIEMLGPPEPCQKNMLYTKYTLRAIKPYIKPTKPIKPIKPMKSRVRLEVEGEV